MEPVKPPRNERAESGEPGARYAAPIHVVWEFAAYLVIDSKTHHASGFSDVTSLLNSHRARAWRETPRIGWARCSARIEMRGLTESCV